MYFPLRFLSTLFRTPLLAFCCRGNSPNFHFWNLIAIHHLPPLPLSSPWKSAVAATVNCFRLKTPEMDLDLWFLRSAV
ncbi:hypothetical protein M5689_006098 [Euphorbia peplus]|nr:hypothetical protein M5689_006098 [Euphorbia peplus]